MSTTFGRGGSGEQQTSSKLASATVETVYTSLCSAVSCLPFKVLLEASLLLEDAGAPASKIQRGPEVSWFARAGGPG